MSGQASRPHAELSWDTLRHLLFPNALVAPSAGPLEPSVAADMISLANHLLVGTALWPAIAQQSVCLSLPEELTEYLQALHAANAERNHVQLAQLERACVTLNQIDVVPTLFKGGARLVAGGDAAIGRRYCSDLDLLVPVDKIADAQALLIQQGYQEYEMQALADAANHRHLNPLVHMETETCIELHRSMVPTECEVFLGQSEQHDMVVAMRLGAARINLPNATSALLTAIIHSELVDDYIHRYVVPMRSIEDVWVLQHSDGSLPDWECVMQRISAQPAQSRFRCFAAMYHRVTGERLGIAETLNWRERAHVAVCCKAITSTRVQRFSARWGRLFPSYLEMLKKSNWQRCQAVCLAVVRAFGRWRVSLKSSG